MCQLNSKDYDSKAHFYNNAKILPCCKRSACNKCIMESSTPIETSDREILFNCHFCKSKTKVYVENKECRLEHDEMIENEFDKNLIEINHYLIKKTDNAMKNVESKLSLVLFSQKIFL